jgi:hypothetical protein
VESLFFKPKLFMYIKCLEFIAGSATLGFICLFDRYQTIVLNITELLNMFNNGELIIQPEYQRSFRWSPGLQDRRDAHLAAEFRPLTKSAGLSGTTCLITSQLNNPRSAARCCWIDGAVSGLLSI